MSTNTNKNQLISFLSPAEREVFKSIQERIAQTRKTLPLVLPSDNGKTTLKIQLDKDKEVLITLQQKAEIRKAKAERLSRKINREQYNDLKNRFVNQ